MVKKMDEGLLLKVKKRDYFSIIDNFSKHSKIQSILLYGEHKNPVPFITVMIPTYRRYNLLREAIISVISQQDFIDYEIIVVDNDPINFGNHENERLIRNFNSNQIIYYRNEENLGMFGNWNRCMLLAKTKWVCMLHDDDVLLNDYLMTMVNIIKNNEISFLSCSLLDIRSKDEIDSENHVFIRKDNRINIQTRIMFCDYKNFNFGFYSPLLGAVYCREKAISIGGFDLNYSIIEDYLFVAKFAFYFPIYQYPVHLYGYRWGANESLNLELWKDQAIHEYYLYRYISQKRSIFVRFCFEKFSKYKIVKLVRSHNAGTSFLKMKCSIDEKSLMESCDISEEDLKGFPLFASQIVVTIVTRYNSIINRIRDLNVERQ